MKNTNNDNVDNSYIVDSGLILNASDISEIFDKIFKKCITLSGRAVIGLINGLYGTEYPLDSKITYNWTEFVDEDKKLRKIIADTIITINNRFSYHLEVQAYYDNEVVLRVFEYGYGHAKRTGEVEKGKCFLRFPEPVIIYLYYESSVPDEYILELEFESGEKTVEYKVPVVKLPEISAEEINRKHMVILIPFHLLKLRYWIKDKKMTKSPEELRYLINHDIIGSIDENYKLGNITDADAVKLKRYTQMLCEYLYVNTDAEGMEVLRKMTDQSFMTDVDVLCDKLEAAEEKLEAAEKKAEAAEKKGKQDAIIELLEDKGEISEKLEIIIRKESDVEVLRKWLKLAAKVERTEEFRTKMNDI